MGLGIGRSNEGEWVIRSASWNARTKEMSEIVHFKAPTPEILKRDVQHQIEKTEKEMDDHRQAIDELEDVEIELYAMLDLVEEVSHEHEEE